MACVAGLAAPDEVQAQDTCLQMHLPVDRVIAPPETYVEFCLQYDGACELTGPEVLEWTSDTHAKIAQINAKVNAEITVVPDWQFHGLEDVWDYPFNCQGDCEDIALEKRRQLTEAGLPSAAFTLALALKNAPPVPHALLLVETTHGTWVLDNLQEDLLCWTTAPYTITYRERTDGQWERYAVPR